MPTPDYQPPRGSTAVFSGPWLRYEPVSGFHRYYEGYLATVIGWWNGAFEFSLDRDSVTALAQMFGAMANYVGGDWRTVDFDGRTLTVALPLSLGGGVHLLQPAGGRYRIGWGLSWLPVDPSRCDRLFGQP
ncbi:hypothetical protein I0C86_38195 [Plantactinospora sp. S1510]|uniref:Uncharacterized protein n=1 Tax=Plantactinospora alkalitolerans TaxID=2789879 RepID=A0ABS0H8C2_9ACTN|nr:hypothetical protein [Plantactinospora alkalitolerans]MBF9134721.1 hypothetical protein [Plantactinospora alkalitolerans]